MTRTAVHRLTAALIAGLSLATTGCGQDSSEVLDCDDILPAEQATYSQVADLVVGPGPKSCFICHSEQSPVFGYDFSSRDAAYDALTNKMHLIYPQVASGKMPQGTVPWNDEDLRLLRSWYCHGAFYDSP